MKHSERYELIDRVARELQSRFKTYELDGYLRSFGLDTPNSSGPISSKWVYAKSILSGVPVETVLKIADDLDLNTAALISGASLPPKNWESVQPRPRHHSTTNFLFEFI